jgi:hypothetical protein
MIWRSRAGNKKRAHPWFALMQTRGRTRYVRGATPVRLAHLAY